MKLVVGLGNPGKRYKNTRHNVGFRVVDALASKVDGGKWMVDRRNHNTLYTKHQSLILAKPQTYMNSSGEAVSKIVNHYKINTKELWIIHDDLDLPLDEFKVQFAKGPKLHNGMESIEEKLGTKEFWRVRVGVDNRETGNRIPGEEYVLQQFSDEEKETIDKTTDKIVEELISILKI